MRFDSGWPKRGDGPGGDGDLPADLEQLGRRLTAQAQRLAATYPPADPARMAGLRAKPAIRSGAAGERLRWLAAAAAIIAAGLFLWSEAQHGSPRLPAPIATAPHHPPASSAAAMLTPAVHQHAAEAVLREVSGPELEGLLDLWEQENSAGASVSI